MEKQYEHFDLQRLNDINIVEVARQLYLPVRRDGVNYVTNCLWHDDEHPSLVLYNKQGNQHCHCYSCNEHHSVIDLAMKAGGWTFKESCEWLSRQFGISTTSTGYVPQPKRQLPNTKPIELLYIPMEMVDRMVSTESSLCRCLMHMARGKDALWTPETVEWQVEEYRLGCYALGDNDDYTVFPSIDSQGKVCNLKIQHYDTDPSSARFCHDDKGQSYWLASMWIKQNLLSGKKEQYRTNCLFGEHLLQRYPGTTVALVESPKNALFGALAYPDMLWLATGNKNNLSRQVLQALQGRDVLVIPDRDAIDSWSVTIQGMGDLANFTVSDFCEHHAPENELKFDIADYLQAQVSSKEDC